jgi:hypothetical protein
MTARTFESMLAILVVIVGRAWARRRTRVDIATRARSGH